MTNDVEIKIHGTIPKNAIVFEGFQGVGLVATLAAQYIADKTSAKIIGHITSSLFPPMALLVNGEIKHPMVVYSFKKGAQDYIIFESELPMPQKLVNIVAEKIVEFADKNKAKQIVCLEGIATAKVPEQSGVFGFTTTKGSLNKYKDKIQLLQNGMIIGVSAAVMLQAKLSKIPAMCLVAEAHADFPDGLAAAGLIKKLNDIYKFNIDVADLEKESKKFEDQLMSIIEKANQFKDAGVKTPGKTYIG